MVRASSRRLGREDWIRAAIRTLQERGVDGVKVVVLAEDLGVTSGSFYWHFKGIPELFKSLLNYWETVLTDAIIAEVHTFEGSASDRILALMTRVIEEDAAALDHTISVWARRDPEVRECYERTLKRRFEFAAWMFRQAGHSRKEAAIRGRLMVAYLMGESATLLKSDPDWRNVLKREFAILEGGAGSK